jgi:hypothetical protein
MALTAKSDMVDKDNVAVRFVMTDDVTGTVVLISSLSLRETEDTVTAVVVLSMYSTVG